VNGLQFVLELELEEQQILAPYDNFVYALKAKETKRQYPHRLDKFLVFMGLKGTIEKSVLNFMNSQKITTLQSNRTL
jgi:hypothetical protein